MPAPAENHQVVAIDQRGYNWSDQPEGIESYAMNLLVDDVLAVVKHFQRDQAIIVGHDWGGMVAWQWLDRDLTLVTIPDADHFVQQDAADQVTKTMVRWLQP